MRSSLLTLLITLILPANAIARECPDLSNAAAYESKNLLSYKLLSEGKDDWIFRTSNDYKYDFSLNDKTIAHLRTLNAGLEKRGTHLIVALLPTRGMVNYTHISQADLSTYKIPTQNTLWSGYKDRVAQLEKSGIDTVAVEEAAINEILFFYKQDHHWRPEGAQLMAKNVASKIKALPVYKDLPISGFKTEKHKDAAYKGTFTKVYKTLCGYNLQPQNVPVFETTHTQPSDEQDLFGDSQAAVVLVGTSNSVNATSRANFDGFLKENLQTDVLNLSETGGGADDAMLKFLASDGFRNTPPKILIWELPVYYDLNKLNSFYKKAEGLVK